MKQPLALADTSETFTGQLRCLSQCPCVGHPSAKPIDEVCPHEADHSSISPISSSLPKDGRNILQKLADAKINLNQSPRVAPFHNAIFDLYIRDI